jgi:hypothetical protein
MLLEADMSALDVLSVPQSLRSSDPDDGTWQAILMWADPCRSTLSDNPYTARLKAEDVTAALGVAG